MLQEIEISRLRNHPQNVRRTYGDLEELAESIKKNGVMQNLTVIPDPEKDGCYLVVIGNRRLLAAQRPDWKLCRARSRTWIRRQ